MPSILSNLTSELQYQQRRCADILAHAKQLGAQGEFVCHMLSLSLTRADKAVCAKDPLAMLQAKEDLSRYKAIP